jgi:hypothetical protein
VIGNDLAEFACPRRLFPTSFGRVNGWRMHYVDQRAGDPTMLLRRNPTWSFPDALEATGRLFRIPSAMEER